MEEKIYNLEERTAIFGEETLKFVRNIKITDYNKSIISQLIKAATSVGANYMEATGGESTKDFIHKIGICKKEAKEVKHWLRMLVIINSELTDRARVIWQEAHELVLIFSKVIITSRKRYL
jgi:four helix bundle protein